MVFVRGPEQCEIQHFVEKVVFRLHDSFPKPKRGECLQPLGSPAGQRAGPWPLCPHSLGGLSPPPSPPPHMLEASGFPCSRSHWAGDEVPSQDVALLDLKTVLLPPSCFSFS